MADDEDIDPRFTFANERTYLAWNRTALALIGGGLAAGQLLTFDSEAIRVLVSLPPILLGALLAASSFRRWAANERAMRAGKPLPTGAPTPVLAYGLALMGVVIAILVLVDAVHG